MNEVLIDTCVLLDRYLQARSRHSDSLKLFGYFASQEIFVKIPTTAMFEIIAAFKHQLINSTEDVIINETPINFKIRQIEITQDFIEKYLDSGLPYLKGADFIFLCIAAKEKIPFVTEDDKMYNKAKEANLEVYKIQEYLDKFVK